MLGISSAIWKTTLANPLFNNFWTCLTVKNVVSFSSSSKSHLLLTVHYNSMAYTISFRKCVTLLYKKSMFPKVTTIFSPTGRTGIPSSLILHCVPQLMLYSFSIVRGLICYYSNFSWATCHPLSYPWCLDLQTLLQTTSEHINKPCSSWYSFTRWEGYDHSFGGEH